MSGVITHACTTLMNVDALTEEQCRAELKSLQELSFAKDLQIITHKETAARLDSMLERLCDLFIEENFSKLHAELHRMSVFLQEKRADLKAAAAARKVH
ncbi:hypothetical protein HBO32_09985 [Pseudomonas nitroreducens]|uniref:hypothetical protein n=1 Tax=Pseudomonas TaxID=286 RepID=UPI001472EC03|nr:hypothetical protein [Pseudomonas nitroreducens]NMZ73428.1 hypothetical protein [Pseudomonas nitroreducens]